MSADRPRRAGGVSGIVPLFILVLVAAVAAPAAAAEGSWVESWLAGPTMTGNWLGVRDALVRTGITPGITYTADLLANPVGGVRRGQAYAGALDAVLDVDLERLLGLPGLTFEVSGNWASGSDLSADAVGNIFTAAAFFEGDRVRLYTLFLEQTVLEERFSLKVGRFATTDDFLSMGVATLFVNGALNPSVYAVEINVPGVTAEPIATWGGRIRVRPHSSLTLAVGAFYSNPTLDQDASNGIDFAVSGQNGYFVIGEVGYRPQEAGAGGRPGHYRIGAYYDSNRYASLAEPSRSGRGNYGVYALADQMVFREGASESGEGLTLFAALTVAPRQSINPMPWFAAAGLIYRGLLPGRGSDRAGMAVYYGGFSGQLPGQSHETVLEWTYAIAATPWLTIQPDIQYVINPNGQKTIKDALIIGAQVVVQF